MNTGAFSFMASGRRSGRGSQHSMVLFVGAAPQMRHSARWFLAAIIAPFPEKTSGSYSPAFAKPTAGRPALRWPFDGGSASRPTAAGQETGPPGPFGAARL